MLQIEQIDEWHGQEVRDESGERIGKLDEVFYDSASGEPRFITIVGGRFGRRRYLVALANATIGHDYVRVGYSAAQVMAVGASDTDGQLDPEALRAATESYGVPIVADARFESSARLTTRHADAASARERADELEQEAARASAEAAERRDEAVRAAAAARSEADRRDTSTST